MEKKELIHTKVIHIFPGDVTINDIYPAAYLNMPDPPTPAQCAFANNLDLRPKLDAYVAGTEIAIVCNGIFGVGLPQRPLAVDALMAYNLTIIANSISQDFLPYCNELKQKMMKSCEIDSTNTRVTDDLDIEPEIQTFKVINRRTGNIYHCDPIKHTKEKDDKLK